MVQIYLASLGGFGFKQTKSENAIRMSFEIIFIIEIILIKQASHNSLVQF